MEAGQSPPPAQPPATPPPGSPGTPPPTPPPAGPPVRPAKGDTGWRVLTVIVALLFGFGGAVMIAVSLDLADGPLCDEVQVATELEDGECFDVSSTQQTIGTALLGLSGLAAGAVFLLGFFFVFTGRAGRAVAVAAGAAIVLGAIGFLIA